LDRVLVEQRDGRWPRGFGNVEITVKIDNGRTIAKT
jgi:hypothetical protein